MGRTGTKHAKHAEHASIDHTSEKAQTLKKNGTYVLVGLLIPVLVVLVVFPKVVLPLTNCAPAGPQESIAVPIQQVSSIVANDLEIDDVDKDAISAVLPYDDLKALYTQASADAVKDKWNRSSTSKDKLKFLVTWVKLGFKYPAEYVNAIWYCHEYFTVGSLCIDDMLYNGANLAWWGWPDKGGANIFPNIAETYVPEGHSFLYNNIIIGLGQKTPVVHMFFDRSVYCLWIPIMSLCLILLLRHRQKSRRKISQASDLKNGRAKSQENMQTSIQRLNLANNQGNLLMFFPIVLSIAVLLLVPAPQARYGFNMLFLAPYIFSIGYICRSRQNNF